MSVTSTRSRGKGRGGVRGGRGRHLGLRSGAKIGRQAAQSSIEDHFGFGVYNFDDDQDDFLDFEKQKSNWKNSSHKLGQSSSSAHKTTSQFLVTIDVDEDSHEADDLSEAGQGQSSRSVTPAQKSRSVTPDSQESKHSKISTSLSAPSRPVSSTGVISSKSSTATSRSVTPFQFVDLDGGDTMADEETTNDAVYNDIDHRNTSSAKKSKHRVDKQGVKLCRNENFVPEEGESDLDKISVSLDHSPISDKKTEVNVALIKGPEEPESQPMATIDDSSYSSPHSELDVFTTSEEKTEKRNNLGNKTHTVNSIPSVSDVDLEDEEKRQNIPLSKRLELDRIKVTKEKSKMEADLENNPDLAVALKLSKEQMLSNALDKPKEKLSEEEKHVLKEFLSDGNGSHDDAKENSEAEKVLKDEKVSDKDAEEETDKVEVITKVGLRIGQYMFAFYCGMYIPLSDGKY